VEDVDEPERPPTDYRFLLANERTYLAYVRTGLALQVAGLGVLQFLTQGPDALRLVLGLALIAAGSYVGAAGYRRTRQAEADIRAGRELSPPKARATTTVVVVVAPLLVGLVIALR
jgi:putative membrane protein